MAISFAQPRRWSREELQDQRDAAEARFTELRREEGPRAYASVYAEIEPTVEAAFAITENLARLTAAALVRHPGLWRILRYCCAPPISEEDLWTMVGRKFRQVPADVADRTAEAVRPLLDPVRFPWIEQERPPTDHELRAAVLATTAILASAETATRRRGGSSVRQEAAVAGALTGADFVFDVSRKPISVVDALSRGTFSRERKVYGAKCDIPVRLRDGRLLAIECKVSNGPKNSWKRLNREVGGKANAWRSAFGIQVVTAAVLAGVFDLSCVVSAQDSQDVTIFWEHDLTPLHEFVDRAR